MGGLGAVEVLRVGAGHVGGDKHFYFVLLVPWGTDHHGLDDVRVIGEGQLLGVLGVDHFLLALAGAYALSTLSLSVGVHGAMYVLL